MTKRTITIWWLVGAIVMIVGGFLALFSLLAFAPHLQNLSNNGEYNNFVPDSTFWTLLSLIILGGIAVIGGIVVQFVAWLGAVMNTNQLVDKTWFNLLLWVGIVGIVLSPFLGLGGLIWWGVMIVYLVGGPDGTVRELPPLSAVPTEPPKTLAPTG